MTWTLKQRALAVASVIGTGLAFAAAVSIRGVRQFARERGRR